MKREELTRRDFSRLTGAAMGGLLTGTAIGCSGGDEKKTGEKKTAQAKDTDAAKNGSDGEGKKDDAQKKDSSATDGDQPNPLLSEPHVCRGLNTCKSKGAGGENACAGQGTCATAEHHECHTQNACKGQGGCGEKPGQNACKGKGECAVPLGEDAWKKARAKFEELMKAADKPVGAPPSPGGDASAPSEDLNSPEFPDLPESGKAPAPKKPAPPAEPAP